MVVIKICIIAEGSYPYVTGGVSSWIQMLINAIPEHEIILCTINSSKENNGNYKYKLPGNVVKIHEVFLDDYFYEKQGKFIGAIDPQSISAIKSLLSGEDFTWFDLFSLITHKEFGTISSFVMSRDFYDIAKVVSGEKYLNIPFIDFYWTIRSMVLPLLSIIKQGIPNADIYHSVSTGYAGIMGSLGRFLYNKPFVLTEHGIYTREREEEIIKSEYIKGHFKDIWIRYFCNISRCAYENANEVVTLYGRNKEIEIELGCDEKKISIIPNGIKVADFDVATKVENDDGYLNVGAIVRVVPIKDIKTMIQSFALVKDQVANARIYIMGPTEEDKEYYKECVQLVNDLDVKDVIFTGLVNIKEYVCKMDVLLLTSISEGQPLAILEGMAGEKPFVATDVGSCRELLYGNGDSYGQAGLVAPVMDYEKIAEGVITLLKDKELRESMGQNARKRVAGVYTFECFINGYKEIYNKFGV